MSTIYRTKIEIKIVVILLSLKTKENIILSIQIINNLARVLLFPLVKCKKIAAAAYTACIIFRPQQWAFVTSWNAKWPSFISMPVVSSLDYSYCFLNTLLLQKLSIHRTSEITMKEIQNVIYRSNKENLQIKHLNQIRNFCLHLFN